MRSMLMMALLTLLAATLSCSRGARAPLTPSDPATEPATGPMVVVPRDEGTTESVLAQFELTLDPDTLEATVQPKRANSAAPPQGLIYDADLGLFNADLLSVVGVALDQNQNVVVTLRHAHPLPKPDLDEPPSATNRADLGYTGKLLILADRQEYQFFDGEAVLDPTLVVKADGYVEPRALLPAGQYNTAFPYMLLVDEDKATREGSRYGETMFGNYDAAEGGWSQDYLRHSTRGWTGYDYLHAGQASRIEVTFAAEALQGDSAPIDLAILVQYTDPRGSRALADRFPPEDPDSEHFAYRLPHSALDIDRVFFTNQGFADIERLGFGAPDWILALDVRVRDWDVGAPEFLGQIGDSTNLGAVLQGTSEVPRVEFQAPTLFGSTVHDVPYSGSYSDNLHHVYTSEITSTREIETSSFHYGCVRVTDPEAAVNPGRFGIDPLTLAPDPAFALPTRTWQVVKIRKLRELPPITELIGADAVTQYGQTVTFQALMEREPTTYEWEFFRNANHPVQSSAQRPAVLMDRVGFFEGFLRASDPDGTSYPDSHERIFTYSVAPLVGAPIVRGRMTLGCTGDTVQGEILEAINNPASFTWETGGAATPETLGGSSPQFTLGESGHYRVTVHGTNASGPGAADHLGYIVADTVPYCWTQSFVDPEPQWRFESLGAVDWEGRAAVVYGRWTPDQEPILYLNRALTAVPAGPYDWARTEILSAPDLDTWSDPVLIQGQLALAGQVNGVPTYVRSLNNNPTGPADWAASTMPIAGRTWELTPHRGRPVALSVFRGEGDPFMRLTEALVAQPMSPSDWETAEIARGDDVLSSSTLGQILASNGEGLLVGWTTSHFYSYPYYWLAARSGDAGTSWVRYEMESESEFASQPEVAVSQGLFIHVRHSQTGLDLGRTFAPVPTTPEVWEFSDLTDSVSPYTGSVRVAEIDGRLAIAFRPGGHSLHFLRALTTWPQLPQHWAEQKILDLNWDGIMGIDTNSALLDAGGRPMIVHERTRRQALIVTQPLEPY